MPCYRCGARQSDPGRGPSPWKRGVRGGAQVLVCPDCQRGRDWSADLDSCPACRSTMLARRLGETVCRACGSDASSAGRPPSGGGGPRSGGDVADTADLADEVDRAVARVLGRPPPRR